LFVTCTPVRIRIICGLYYSFFLKEKTHDLKLKMNHLNDVNLNAYNSKPSSSSSLHLYINIHVCKRERKKNIFFLYTHNTHVDKPLWIILIF
jgi:hypothetical protein